MTLDCSRTIIRLYNSLGTCDVRVRYSTRVEADARARARARAHIRTIANTVNIMCHC